MKRKFTIFALFYFVFKGKFQVQAPGGLHSEGRFNWGLILRYDLPGGGGGGYILRGLFSEFYDSQEQMKITFYVHFSGQLVMQDKYHG